MHICKVAVSGSGVTSAVESKTLSSFNFGVGTMRLSSNNPTAFDRRAGRICGKMQKEIDRQNEEH